MIFFSEKNVDLTNFWQNPEWEVTYNNVTRVDTFYPCCKEPYPSVSFFLKIRRNVSIYLYTIFIPAIVAIILSLISFWFPIRSTTRFMISGFSLLLLILLLLYLGTKLGFGSFGTPYASKNSYLALNLY